MSQPEAKHVQLGHGGVVRCNHCHQRLRLGEKSTMKEFMATVGSFIADHKDCTPQPVPIRTTPLTPAEWVEEGDTGLSSLTIWSVMTGLLPPGGRRFYASLPRDSSDFGRCYRLLEHFPEWRARMAEVSAVYPEWAPMVAQWGTLENLYVAGLSKESWPQLNALLEEILYGRTLSR